MGQLGADVFISGSALWKYDTLEEGIADVRRRATQAMGDPGQA